MFYTSRSEPYRSSLHSHSADEIIFLLWGGINFGAYKLEPGDAIAVDRDHRYGFNSAPEGFGFLNYRRDVSSHSRGDGPPVLEGGKAGGMTLVNDVR